ncbi:MAG: ABC transporter permease, partial [Acidobacteriota bacterium]
MRSFHPSPIPRLAERLLRTAWPGPESIVLIGDLDEEYSRHILPRRGHLQARLWYWRQVLRSLPAAAGRRLDQRRMNSPKKIHPKRGGPRMDPLLQDLRYALRGLARSPGLSLVVILTLALGIGAGTAIFSVVNGVVLEELPYQRPSELIRLMPDQAFPISKAAALYLEEHSQSFEMAAWGRSLFPLSGEGEPEDARGAAVFANHFSVLGAPPALGRGFLPSDARPGAARVVILSHNLWVRRYGADPSIVDRSILIADIPHQVVGVMGADHQPIEEDWLLWVPTSRNPQSHLAMAANGRLRPGYTIEQAEQELKRLMPQYWRESQGYEASAEEMAFLRVIPLRDWILGDHEPTLLALLGAVGFVLLIVCANVANLLLALGNTRQHEMGVRLALGAGRGRLVRQMLTESALLGIVGGAAGLFLAAWAVRVGVALLPPQIPRSHNIQIDATVLGFGLAVSLASVLLFGIAPALRSTGRRITSQLNSAARSLTPSAGPLRLNQGLVAAEVALSVVLVAGAGLMLRSLWALQQVDPGFNP